MLFCMFAIAAAGMLTDFGWQKTPNGELEYVLQIEPELLESLREGEEIVSEVPAELSGVRRIRVRVGTGPLPQGEVVGDSTGERLPESQPPAGLPQPPADFQPNTPPSSNPPFEASDPPPLLPRGGAFEPASVGGRAAPSRGAEDAGSGQVESSSPFGGGAFPTGDGSANELKPIPRQDTEPSDASGPMGRLPRRLDDQVRPATAAEPIGNAKTSPAPGQGSVQKREKAHQAGKPAIAPPEAAKPWMPLFLTTLLLFASIGLNVYLAWITRGAMQRYRALARQRAA